MIQVNDTSANISEADRTKLLREYLAKAATRVATKTKNFKARSRERGQVTILEEIKKTIELLSKQEHLKDVCKWNLDCWNEWNFFMTSLSMVENDLVEMMLYHSQIQKNNDTKNIPNELKRALKFGLNCSFGFKIATKISNLQQIIQIDSKTNNNCDEKEVNELKTTLDIAVANSERFVTYRSFTKPESMLVYIKPKKLSKECERWLPRAMKEITFEQKKNHKIVLPRLVAFVSMNAAVTQTQYGGITVDAQPHGQLLDEMLNFTIQGVREFSEVLYRHVIGNLPHCATLNWYRDEKDSVGLHGDTETRPDLILALSVGETRRFAMISKEKFEKGEKQFDYIQSLEHCSITIMLGKSFHQDYLHSLLKESHSVGSRLNVTWRWDDRGYPNASSLFT